MKIVELIELLEDELLYSEVILLNKSTGNFESVTGIASVEGKVTFITGVE